MRYLLLLALLLYDVLSQMRSRYQNMNYNHDYDDRSNEALRRHNNMDDRRLWRKKVQFKGGPEREKQYDRVERRRDFGPRYNNEGSFEDKAVERTDGVNEMGWEYGPQRNRDDHYRDENEDKILQKHLDGGKSEEYYDKELETRRQGKPSSRSFDEKIQDKKNVQQMNCDRTNERFESCFSGCAAVTCDNPRERLRPCYPFCEPGCICVHPYVRDDRTHKCVMPEDCTKGLKGIPDLGGE